MVVSYSQAIDVHSHWVPPGYAKALRAEMDRLDPRTSSVLTSVRDPSNKMRDLSVRLAEMEEAGVGVSVLSLPPPGVTMGHPDRRAALTRLANDEFLEAANDHRGRFAVLVALPLPDVAESLAEIERVATHPCARGINLQAVTEGDGPSTIPSSTRSTSEQRRSGCRFWCIRRSSRSPRRGTSTFSPRASPRWSAAASGRRG